jgi:membrane protease subunit (stomatin/prohibitin family)
MTTPMGYCPHCKQNVLLKREPIDAELAIILFCCSCGIGLIIYLFIHLTKRQDRCIHCTSRATSLTYEQPQTSSQALPPPKTQIEAVESKTAKYCPFCGNQLDNIAQKFCPSCGSKI